MFTGLVQARGRVTELRRQNLGAVLHVECPFPSLVLGESIAVDGVCLSVVTITPDGFSCDASAETLQLSTLGDVRVGNRVHLERALAAGDRLGGHYVTGHVDGVGRIERIESLGDAIRMFFSVPESLAPFCATKASISVDGVSLTVNGAKDTAFDVVLVPVTRRETLLESKGVGARVNLEVDVLAKYVARLLGRKGVDGVAPSSGAGVTLDLLTRAGYL